MVNEYMNFETQGQYCPECGKKMVYELVESKYYCNHTECKLYATEMSYSDIELYLCGEQNV